MLKKTFLIKASLLDFLKENIKSSDLSTAITESVNEGRIFSASGHPTGSYCLSLTDLERDDLLNELCDQLILEGLTPDQENTNATGDIIETLIDALQHPELELGTSLKHLLTAMAAAEKLHLSTQKCSFSSYSEISWIKSELETLTNFAHLINYTLPVDLTEEAINLECFLANYYEGQESTITTQNLSALQRVKASILFKVDLCKNELSKRVSRLIKSILKTAFESNKLSNFETALVNLYTEEEKRLPLRVRDTLEKMLSIAVPDCESRFRAYRELIKQV